MRVPVAFLPPVVLAHHGVADVSDADDPVGLVVPPRLLASQVHALQRAGYRFRTAEELVDGGGRPARGTAVLTFDDGLLDNVTVAAPLLRELGVRATFFVNPGLWGGAHPDVRGDAGRLVGPADVRRLLDLGMEVASHTLSHHDLTTLDDAALDRELAESKRVLEDLTGRPCRTAAYPFGHSDERVQRAAERAGYALAFAWRPGPWRRFAVPRLPGPPRHGGGRLALKVAGVRRRV